MKKNGFTLVELLAVIAILAILVIIALPNVIGMFNDAKKNSFTTEIKEIYKVAQQTWMSESMFKTEDKVYVRCDGCTGQELDLSGRDELKYYIKINKAGKIVTYKATDGSYQYVYNGDGLLIENINDVEQISEINESNIISITDDGGNNSSGTNTPVTTYIYWAKYGMPNVGYTDGFDNYQDAMNNISQNFCVRFTLVDGVKTEEHLVFKKNNTVYYLRGGDAGAYYEDNKQILSSVFGTGCTDKTTSYSCIYNGMTVVANQNGSLNAHVSRNRCEVQSNGMTFCDNM